MWALVVLALIVIILLLPVILKAGYDENGARLVLKIGPFFWKLYPAAEKKSQKQPSRNHAAKKAASPGGNKGGKLSDLIPIVKTLVDFLKDLKRKLVVRSLTVKIILAGDDPCGLSVNYGRTWAGVGNLQPLLNQMFKIRKQNIDVACDYTAEQTRIFANLEISVLFVHLLFMVVSYGTRLLKQYFTMKNNRKGGITHEPETSSNA